MFCEKCGRQIGDDAQFCEHCGAPVVPVVIPAQPADAPVTEPEVIQEQPSDPWSLPPEAAAPKKPIDPKTRKRILTASIAGCVLLTALIVLFAVILPAAGRAREEAAKVDITQYYVIRFKDTDSGSGGPSVTADKISGKFIWDYEKFAEDQHLSTSNARSLLTFVTSTLTVKHSYSDSDKTGSHSFYDLKESDTVRVTFKWPENKKEGFGVGMSSMDYIERYENDYGVKFRHEDAVREYKIADALSAQNIAVQKPVEADILGYIDENHLIAEDGRVSGKASVFVKPFETEIGGFTFKHEESSQYVTVTDKNGKKTGRVKLVFSSKSRLKNGDTVTLRYDSGAKKHLEEKGVILTGESVSYTVQAPEPTTVPSSTAPATKAPTATVPDTTAPATTAPDTTAPVTTAPAAKQ